MTPDQAYFHCREHGRNSELEKIFLTDPRLAYDYARYVIKGRWIEGEKIIYTRPEYAYFYALNVIKGKLPELMHNMMLIHADYWAKKYFEFINNLTPSV